MPFFILMSCLTKERKKGFCEILAKRKCPSVYNSNKKVYKLSLFYYLFYYRLIGLVGRVFANGPGDLGSIPGRVIPKT